MDRGRMIEIEKEFKARFTYLLFFLSGSTAYCPVDLARQSGAVASCAWREAVASSGIVCGSVPQQMSGAEGAPVRSCRVCGARRPPCCVVPPCLRVVGGVRRRRGISSSLVTSYTRGKAIACATAILVVVVPPALVWVIDALSLPLRLRASPRVKV